jgi:hypothetical protein
MKVAADDEFNPTQERVQANMESPNDANQSGLIENC